MKTGKKVEMDMQAFFGTNFLIANAIHKESST